MFEREQLLGEPDTTIDLSHLEAAGDLNQVPLWLLVELANELSTATSFEALRRTLTRKLRWMLDFEQCTLAVQFKPTDTDYQLFNITNPSRAESTSPQKIALDVGWPGKVILESKPYFISDLSQMPPSITMPIHPGLGIAPEACSLMLLPLRVGERTIGSLNFSSNVLSAYSVTWRNIGSLLAYQVAGQLGSVLAQEQTALAMKALAVSQAKLKSAYEFRERVMESATNAIYALDLEGNFTFVNRRTAEITGYRVESLLGSPFTELFSVAEATDIQRHFEEIVERGVSLNRYEAEMSGIDGRQQAIAFSLAPIFLDGEISAVVGTADVCDRSSKALSVEGRERGNGKGKWRKIKLGNPHPTYALDLGRR